MKTIDVNGTPIHYAEKGMGLPLILLHAFPVDRRVWQSQLNDLSSHYRVIAPDFRGFGKSPPARGAAAAPFTIASMAADIRAFAVALKVTPCILGGISMGGYVAMNFTRQFPADLRGLILVDTQDLPDSSEARENRGRMIDLARTKGSKAVSDLLYKKMLSPDTLDHRPDQAKQLRLMMEACPAATIEQALAALRDRPDMTGEMPKISTPTLLIVGEADSITPPKVMEAMQQRLPNAELAQIPGAGHMSPMEQASQVNRAMRRFVEGLKT